jgi:NADPH-dependent ferric siderophore reductase
MPRPDSPQRPPRRTSVVATSWLTPSMVRIVLEGADLADFPIGDYTDHYVKCTFGERTRTYTVRDYDSTACRLSLDFVVHGDAGVAATWAASAEPGDELLLRGPGGGYTPSPEADWHLLVGDESVIPAIAVSLQRIPSGVPVHVVVEVEGPEHEQSLNTDGDLHLTWLHRTHRPGEDPELLCSAVRDLDLPPGQGQAFVHGEASAVLLVRRHLVRERHLTAGSLSATGYWKLRRTDEEWRSEKRDWMTQAEQDLVA